MSATASNDFDKPALEVLSAMINSLALDKATMGRRYGEWAVSAPTLESGVAAAAMAQDELGHARSTFPLLKQLGAASDDEDRMETTSSLALLNAPLPSWETFIAVNLVVDGFLTTFLEAAQDSSFTPLAQRSRKILQEERSHRAHAVAWTRRLATNASASYGLTEAIIDCWSQVANWAGADEDYAHLTSAGLLSESPGELRSKTQAVIAEAVAGTPLQTLWSA
jgi:phenylacetate-CoA oxygenase PaaI subunit